MNEIQAIEQNTKRRLTSLIREDAVKINRFYREYPYCEKCGSRAPKGHVEHIFGSTYTTENSV